MTMSEDFALRLCQSFKACAVDAPSLLKQVHTNVQKMLKDRGYQLHFVAPVPDLFDLMQKDVATVTGSHAHKGSVCVFYHTMERIGVCALRSLINKSSADHTIILSVDGPTNFTRKESEGSNVQYFTFKDMAVCRVEHRLVPSHILVDADAHPEKEHYPKLLLNDPICQYYNFQAGSVVQIDRTAGHSEIYRTFRVVTAS